MPCFNPLTGYRSRATNPNGKRSIVWHPREAHPDLPPITLPCGQCRHCRLEHSRQMAIRCMQEASLYRENCFITLTYDNEHLPENGSLDYEAPVLFMKRLRKKFGEKIRSFGCAEYGELLSRPHYHLCIFNHDFEDKKHWKTHAENKLYRSESLERLWPYGHSSVGNLTFESAAYVARYVTKKISGKGSSSHYERARPTGELYSLLPERSICVSRRPGIGRSFYEKNSDHINAHDFVVLRGQKMRPPKYYDRIFDSTDPQAYAVIKQRRKSKARKSAEAMRSEDLKNIRTWQSKGGNLLTYPTPRLLVLEEVQELKFQLLKRTLENG